MNVNPLAVLTCAVLSMVLGFVWYGPLFGKKWMEIIHAKPADRKAREEMQKGAGKLYGLQFLLSLFQAWVIASFVVKWESSMVLQNVFWIWAGIAVPVLAGACMWNNDPKKVAWARFLIQGSYHLVLLMMYGAVLGMWR